MNSAILQKLNDAQAALSAALETRDVDTLDTAAVAVAAAIEEMRVAGGWQDQPELRANVIRALESAEAARGRINALTDLNRRKLDKLISLAGAPRAVAYQRSGKLG